MTVLQILTPINCQCQAKINSRMTLSDFTTNLSNWRIVCLVLVVIPFWMLISEILTRSGGSDQQWRLWAPSAQTKLHEKSRSKYCPASNPPQTSLSQAQKTPDSEVMMYLERMSLASYSHIFRPRVPSVNKSFPNRIKHLKEANTIVHLKPKPAKTSYSVSNYDVMIAPGTDFSLGNISTRS